MQPGGQGSAVSWAPPAKERC